MCGSVLTAVLEGRDERYALQRQLLARCVAVCQIVLNIPGYPKRLAGDTRLLDRTRALLLERLPSYMIPEQEHFIENGAGAALLIAFTGVSQTVDPIELKKRAIELEEELPFGRLLDADVLTSGGSIGRAALGIKGRKCLLCENEAKICARNAAHPVETLRACCEELIREAENFI